MKYKLKDLATIERAKKGKEYPKDSTLIQVSATQGQTILHQGGEVESKYAVVQSTVLKPIFLFFYLETTMEKNITKIKADINIQMSDLENYPIEFPIRR